MSDNNKPLDPTDEKRLKTRGIGIGRDYQPFVFVQDFSSSGESVRIPSATVGRVHHLLSGLELAAFVLFDWCKDTIDLREQYPLPLDATLSISSQLGVKHPQTLGKLRIVTTDLVVDFSNRKPLALSVKPSADLQDDRTLEKLQIERSYWENEGVDWHVFTENEVSPVFKENLHWLRPFLEESESTAFHVDEQDVADLSKRLGAYPSLKVTKACAKLDDEYQLSPGSHLTILRYAVARRHVIVPIQKSFQNWVGRDLTKSHTPYVAGAKSAS